MSRRNIALPERLVRASQEVTIDVEQRTVDCTFMTRRLARDGGIIDPAGVITRSFSGSVLAMHGMTADFPVIGRALNLRKVELGLAATTQFAQTRMGEEIGHLYGINPAKTVYCRSWSFGWRTLEERILSLDEARAWLGADWDEELVPPQCRRWNEVWFAARSEMHEYSAVAVGSDRDALSRAHADGVRAAGELVAQLDLKEAAQAIEELRANQSVQQEQIVRLERDLKALRSDGAAAAARGDTAELVHGLRALIRKYRD